MNRTVRDEAGQRPSREAIPCAECRCDAISKFRFDREVRYRNGSRQTDAQSRGGSAGERVADGWAASSAVAVALLWCDGQRFRQ